MIPKKEDERNKLIRFTVKGKEYADAIISKLRKVELFVSEEMQISRLLTIEAGRSSKTNA